MRSLLRAELARVRARPLVLGVLVVVTLGAVGLVLFGWWDTRPPTGAQVEAAHVQLAEAERLWQAEGEAVVERCKELEAGARAKTPEVSFGCDAMAPVVEAYLPYRPDLATVLVERLPTVWLMAVIGMLMTGVGLVTAEFRSGAIATWLTFAPRRGRVFLSKLVAACVAALVVAVVPTAVALGGLVAVCALNGAATGVDAVVAGGLATSAARWIAVGIAATVAGHGLGFAVRHAAGVTGIVVWWAATVESALPLVLPAAGWVRTSTNLEAWLTGQATYTVVTCVADPRSPEGRFCEGLVHTVGAGQGALATGVLVAVTLLAGWLSFRLRDVT
ncbi:hypothetical protein [Cellulomonas sp. S1-8]|uniref:hypothetical protein n=1 Tax=Cellulomonas sp. S1-8 TaxID=2904790 RepID=UPI00224334D0|nr:hypothetical protein [Cellulomonas sp. S1-8]UZN04544.1 hypothetical protein OKX07_06415 [Cellulomonas sp. S1-8]